MKLTISGMARENDLYSSFHPDVISLIYRYIPGKDGSLILKQNQIRDLRSDIQYEFDNVVIPFGSHLRVKKWESKRNSGGRLIIHCFDLIFIQNGGSIDVSKSGYLGGALPLRCGESYDHYGPKEQGTISGNGAGGGGICGGGGSYGTAGKDGFRANRKVQQQDINQFQISNFEPNMNDIWNIDTNDTNGTNDNDTISPLKVVSNDSDMGKGGKVYGDPTIKELHLGSGGGSSFKCGAGRGGGALLLITNNLVNKGRIECCGADAKEWGSGGGSGGSIIIDVLGEKECVLGDIKATGGYGARMHGFMRTDKGGDGGDGRICINDRHSLFTEECFRKIRPSPVYTVGPRIDGNKYCN